MPAEGRENPLLKKGNSDAFFREKYLTKNKTCKRSSIMLNYEVKNSKERYIQIASSEILGILKNYYRENAEEIKQSGFFFVNNRGGRYTEQSIRLMLKKYTKLAGIERNITPHMFRHSFATYLIEEGVDISCVQQILGHSSIKTTQIYIHVAAKKQAEILRELHPRNRMNIFRLAA